MASELDSNALDLRGALERALANAGHSDPRVRNDALVFLELATVYRNAVSIDFEGLAVASPEQRRDAVDTLAAVFDINRQIKTMRSEMDWKSIDLIDEYAIGRMRSMRNNSINKYSDEETIEIEGNPPTIK